MKHSLYRLDRLCLFLFVLILLFNLAAARAEVPIPELRSRVTDLSATLSKAEHTTLEQRISAFEAEKGAQIAVLILPSVSPESIEGFGIRLAERWKIGRKGINDGVILIVARNDRQLRIEVGYGLEGVLPDAIAHRIIDETIVPKFREGKYFEGIDNGVATIMKVISGEPLPEPTRRWSSSGSSSGFDGLWFLAIFLGAGLAQFLRKTFGRFAAALAGGVIAGALAWIFVPWFMALILGAVGFFIFLTDSGFGGRGGYYSSRGGWSSGGSGGGGFRGGGGSFGGGGASGRW